MANMENLKPFTKDNAKEMGKRGGVASGITRKRKALIKKRLIAYCNLQDYINTLSDIEYEDFIKDLSEEQRETITRMFKPTKEQTKEMFREIRKIIRK